MDWDRINCGYPTRREATSAKTATRYAFSALNSDLTISPWAPLLSRYPTLSKELVERKTGGLLSHSPAEWEQCSKTLVAQIDSQPGEHCCCEWDEWRIQFPDSHVSGDRAAQVARENHGAENCGPRYYVQQ